MKGSLQIKKNNKYYVYVRIDGKQKAIATGIEATTGNKKKAEKKMIQILSELDKNPKIYDKIPFVTYAQTWLAHNEKQVDEITFINNKQNLEKHIIPYFEPLKINLQDIKPSDIEDYYNFKSQSGRLDGKSGGLSRETIRRHGAVLNLIFNFALHDGLINNNPCTFAKIPRVAKEPKEINIYTVEQCMKLLQVLEGEPLHDMVYITFLYGLRREELMGLRWCDVDFANNRLYIRNTAVSNGIVVRKEKTKTTSSRRTYPLLTEIRDLLLNIKETQNKWKEIFGDCYTDSGYVFTRENGTPFYPDYPTKRLAKFIKKYELPYLTFHELRKSCVTMLLLEKGWSMKEVSDWVGHSDIQITMQIYAQVTKNHKQHLADKLSGTLSLK